MPKVSKLHESVEKKEDVTKSQQQKSPPEASWFYRGQMSFKTQINDSYTKLEIVSVQGVQQ